MSKTISFDINKATNNKLRYIQREFKEWMECPDSRRDFLDDGSGGFESYLNIGEGVRLLSLAASDISHWYFMGYSTKSLTELNPDCYLLALASHHAYACVIFKSVLIDQNQMTSGLLLTEAAFNLSLIMISGWGQEFRTLLRALRAGLDTELLDLRVTPKHNKGRLYRHFWFLMHLACDVEGLNIDTSVYSYPDSLAPYDEVLADWKTTDLDKVTRMVQRMADFHVLEAKSDRRKGRVYEFENESRMLFPYEIFAFLRLREWLGLDNPGEFDHPLMQQPLGRMPIDPGTVLARPQTPLLDQVVAKFNQQYPNAFPLPKD
ncbi:hypothetical protein D3C84_264880 [compost metagenome]